jgi:hypothetical protein
LRSGFAKPAELHLFGRLAILAEPPRNQLKSDIRAVTIKTESWNRSIYLFLRIILRIEAGSEISPVD